MKNKIDRGDIIEIPGGYGIGVVTGGWCNRRPTQTHWHSIVFIDGGKVETRFCLYAVKVKLLVRAKDWKNKKLIAIFFKFPEIIQTLKLLWK